MRPKHPSNANAIINYLLANADGPANARTRSRIEAALGIKCERELRIIANEIAPARNIALCSSDLGYYIARRREDFDPMLSRLGSQINEMRDRTIRAEALRDRLFPARLA